MPSKAPIALFVYKRPVLTERVLDALSRCVGAEESELFIFCDGAKRWRDRKKVREVRKAAKSRQWCGKVNIIEKKKNEGLANSIIGGVTELCERYGKVIVIEDDLIVSKYFLEYMNSALDRYEDEPKVMQISGHMFPVELKETTDAVLLPMTTTWGWGTWKRAWRSFDAGMSGYERLKEDTSMRLKFDLDGTYPYYKMLEGNKLGKVDSWGIRWYLTVFMQNGLVLFPVKSLVENVGFDRSGTNCASHSPERDFSEMLVDFKARKFPALEESSVAAFDEIKRFLSVSMTQDMIQGPIKDSLFVRLRCQLYDIISRAR